MGITETIRLEKNVSTIMDIVHEMRSMGYKQGVDFDFAYHAPKFDYFGSTTEVAFAEFMFYNNSLASWFVLKYS